MRIRQILGENGAMPQLCNGGKCPAVIVCDDGNAYVQGYQLTIGEAAALMPPGGEGFVKIPLATLKKIAVHVGAV